MNWIKTHPRISAWLLLSVGMVALLVYEARDVGLLPGQWIALTVATILVAGACIWIISWEDATDAENQDENLTATQIQARQQESTQPDLNPQSDEV
ncbi:hypothetical protein MASR2M15_27210 [Anaerolineales bacterium]